MASPSNLDRRSRLSRRDFSRLALAAPLAATRTLAGASTARGHLGGGAHDLTILYTNDFHSAFEPLPAFWLRGSPRLGGAAHLTTLIERERAAAPVSFLLDSGDMFTGTLSRLTRGEALLELMTLMRYDAMGVGNHEFSYGWQALELGMTRVPFPILCCNVRYRGTGMRFCRPYTILERNGVRLGVIGVIGTPAATRTIMPSMVAALEFTDPVAEARSTIENVRPLVDVVVVLAHQGLPGPMQSDAEVDASVQRPLDEDLAFCGAITGIDLYIAAHSHHGLEQPIVHPDSGTLITQTYGYGTRLGRVRLTVRDRRVVRHDIELLKVWSDELPPDPGVLRRVAYYRAAAAAEIGPPIGRVAERLTRKYTQESALGSFCSDVMRRRARTDVGLMNSGALRADLPQGEVDRGHVLDAFPFLNDLVTIELEGRDLKAVLEQGLSLEAGMIQTSGLRGRYDLSRPVRARLVDLDVNGAPVRDDRRYRVATNSFLAEGGDGYDGFRRGLLVARDAVLNEVLTEHIKATDIVSVPDPGRLVPARD